MPNGTSETPDYLYRPPTDGEGEAHAHKVRKTTPKQVHIPTYIERVAEDGTVANPKVEEMPWWHLNRAELKRRGSVYHSGAKARYYRSREAAMEAA